MTEQFMAALKKVNSKIFEYPDADLIADGIIDSLDVMNLTAMLEDTLGIELDPEEITPENFENVNTIWEMVKRAGYDD